MYIWEPEHDMAANAQRGGLGMIPASLSNQFVFEPAESYHAAAKDYLTSHHLAELLRDAIASRTTQP